jgi:lipooligosaccharide transport system permease protein
MAFCTPITAWVAQAKNDAKLPSLFRFVIVPLFLFSGTFFPITQLPEWMQPVAYFTPLWHGVELARGAAGIPLSPHFPWYVHTGALLAIVVVGAYIALRNMAKELRK